MNSNLVFYIHVPGYMYIQGEPVFDEDGELVCTKPFPSICQLISGTTRTASSTPRHTSQSFKVSKNNTLYILACMQHTKAYMYM